MQHFWVCLTCDKWSCHIGDVPLLHVGYEKHIALIELMDEHTEECPDAAFLPVSAVTRAFRSVQ